MEWRCAFHQLTFRCCRHILHPRCEQRAISFCRSMKKTDSRQQGHACCNNNFNISLSSKSAEGSPRHRRRWGPRRIPPERRPMLQRFENKGSVITKEHKSVSFCAKAVKLFDTAQCRHFAETKFSETADRKTARRQQEEFQHN